MMRQRHEVRLAHLHPGARYVPLRVVEIDLDPLSGTKLPWPDEDERRKSQRQRGDGMPGVAMDGAQELPHPRWIGDRGEVARSHRRQRFS